MDSVLETRECADGRPAGMPHHVPMAYVDPTWEYKYLVRTLPEDAPPDEAEPALPDVAQEHPARRTVPREVLRVPEPICVDLPERTTARAVDEGVACGNSMTAVRAVGTQRVDAEELPEERAEVLRVVERVAAAASIGEANVEQAIVFVSGLGERIERDPAAVVVLERLFDAQHLTRRTAVVPGCGSVPRGPLEQHGVVGAAPAVRSKLWNPTSPPEDRTRTPHAGSWMSRYSTTLRPS